MYVTITMYCVKRSLKYNFYVLVDAPLDEHLVDLNREAKVKPLSLKQFKL